MTDGETDRETDRRTDRRRVDVLPTGRVQSSALCGDTNATKQPVLRYCRVGVAKLLTFDLLNS